MRCILCHTVQVPARFMVCRKCVLKYHLGEWRNGKVWIYPRRRWPAWARALRNSYRREQWGDQAWQLHAEPLTQDDVPASQTNSSVPPSTPDTLIAEGWLEYAPYCTEEENRQYRRSNGIPEREV